MLRKPPKSIMVMSCSNKNYWYKDMVGKKFKVIKESNGSYTVSGTKQPGGKAFIKIEDCAVIE